MPPDHSLVVLGLDDQDRKVELPNPPTRRKRSKAPSHPMPKEGSQDIDNEPAWKSLIREKFCGDMKDVSRRSHEYQSIYRGPVGSRKDARRAAEGVAHQDELSIGKPFRSIPGDRHEVITKVSDRYKRSGATATVTTYIEQKHVVPELNQRLGNRQHRRIVGAPTVSHQQKRLKRLGA